MTSAAVGATLPRFVVTAAGSGHGKTTVATGLMAALRSAGLEVAGAKVGPDYIDPGYHALATGRPGRNLDAVLCSPALLPGLLLHGAAGADVAIVEGVMGLFDGQLGTEGYGSTAHVAGLIGAPLILVLDVSSVSRTAAALVHGLNTFDPATRLAGVVLNKAGSVRHAREVTTALEATGLEVLGVLPRDAGIEAPSRHLGLVPAAERRESAEIVRRLGELLAEHVDLTKIMAVAHSAPPLEAEPWDPPAVLGRFGTLRSVPGAGNGSAAGVAASEEARGALGPSKAHNTGHSPVVAIAGGRAFTFRYAETEELLRAAGCEPVTFDPLVDRALPPRTAGLYLGGGFPEMHATDLATNSALLAAVRDAVLSGVPTVAECAGLLYLCRSLDGVAMAGVLQADATMTPRLTLGYRTLVADHDQLLAPAGSRVTGHEFHRTQATPVAGATPAWLADGTPVGFSVDPAGLGRPTLHASYQHVHWAGHPGLARRFAEAIHDHAHRGLGTEPLKNACYQRDTPGQTPIHGVEQADFSSSAVAPEVGAVGYDLDHHGDHDLGPGLIDLAVNVRVPVPPGWLIDVINQTTERLAAYPDGEAAVAAIAAAHRVGPGQVLPTAGAAEAFTLIARALRAEHPLIVHPQFTEPEAALRAAGHDPARLILAAQDGFVLDPADVPGQADLIVIGNPTNPTGVLHPATALRSLIRPGRVVVVDEAFADAVPGEPESLIGGTMPGLLVTRSLTKTWGLAGLRAGYVVGDAGLIARLRAQQPPWSVSTPAVEVIKACLTPAARRLAARAAHDIDHARHVLIAELTRLGLSPAARSRAPFILVDVRALGGGRPAGWVREELRRQGFAVRRGDTFPGLGPDWIRVAVRDEATSRAFVDVLQSLDQRVGASR